MEWLSAVMPFLAKLGEALKQFLLSLFIYKQGQKDVQLDSTKEILNDAVEANLIDNRIKSLSDSDLDSILLSEGNKPDTSNKQ